MRSEHCLGARFLTIQGVPHPRHRLEGFEPCHAYMAAGSNLGGWGPDFAPPSRGPGGQNPLLGGGGGYKPKH